MKPVIVFLHLKILIFQQELQLAVNISVCMFNSGILWTFKKLFDECMLVMSDITRNIFRQIDINCIKKAGYHSSERRKSNRKKVLQGKNK